LITGKVRPDAVTERQGQGQGHAAHELAVQDTRVAELHKQGGGEFLSQRTWQGLEQELGETSASKAVEGSKGLAWAYDGEGTQNDNE
jgi:hypothetical protein